MIRLLPFVVVLLLWNRLHAQERPVINTDSSELIMDGKPLTFDTISTKSIEKRFSPRKALLYSAVLPGLGQVYNKKYWKIPFVYGGFYGLGFGLNFNHTEYKKYKRYLFEILEGTPKSKGNTYTQDQLRPAIDRYRRDRDFLIILMGGMYLLQIVDAHVDAHLKEFDVNPKLQVRIRPLVENDQVIGRQGGVSLTIKF